jgi:hypothetical protein
MARRAGLTQESIGGKLGEVVTIECNPGARRHQAPRAG